MQNGPGFVVGEHFEVVQEIAHGGFGRVWRAADTRFGIEVAVKQVILPVDGTAAEAAERVARAASEARNAVKLRERPNVVSVYDVVVQDGVPWIVMQLVDGMSLASHLTAHGPLAEADATRLARGLVEALVAADQAGIVHRDLKPANVMLARNGEALLTDFGIAVHRDDGRLTGTGMFIGSAGYAAPERVRGEDSGSAGDCFSLGATLYQAVEGVPAFRCDIITSVVFDRPRPPSRAGTLTDLIMRLLDTDPQTRPTIYEVRALLNGVPEATITVGYGRPVPVLLPAMGESASEATITRWLKQVGDVVAINEPLVEVCTDKVDTEIPSPAAGVLISIDVLEDQTAAIGARIAVIG